MPLAIFDIDGTLVDSRYMIQEAMVRAFKAQGLPAPSYDTTRSIVGLSLKTAIDRIAPRDLDSEALDALVEGYKNAFIAMRQAGEEHEPLYDDAAKLLETLNKDGWTLGVATGKSRRGLDAVINREGWSDVFACSFCADDGPGKPHPHMVLENLRAANVPASHAVIIGDTHFDMAMGKSAGVHAIGVDWGFHTASEIQTGGADVMISTMAELYAALGQFKTKLAI